MMLVDYIDRGARTAPHAPCMVSPAGEVLMTHQQFNAVTHRVAAALVADGLQLGDRVAIYSPNDAHAFACVVGVLRAGGIWTAVNAANQVPELIDFLNVTECSRLIYHGGLTARAAILIDEVPTITHAVSIGPGRDVDPELSAFMAPQGATADEIPFDTEQVVMMGATGGTTGRSKAVPISNRQFHLMCTAFNVHLAEPEPPRYICATPMTHAAGCSAFPVLAEGGCIIIHEGVVPKDIFASIEQNRATRIFLPPTALYSLLAQPDVRDHDFSSLQQFLVSASPIAPERLAEAVDVFGPVMAQAFGQAEAPFICAILDRSQIAEAVSDTAKRRRLGSCGQPSVVARIEIMADDGTILGPDQRGEIVVRSDLVFSGYWNNPEATATTVRPGGWHGTGDVGVRDEDGFIYVVDRMKDMIITGGFNVYPAEVEAVIHTFAGVNDCAVIGIPDDKWGEAVTAVIEPKPDASIDEASIIAECKARLGSVKAPKSIVIGDLPRSPVGKILKRELREGFWVDSARRV